MEKYGVDTTNNKKCPKCGKETKSPGVCPNCGSLPMEEEKEKEEEKKNPKELKRVATCLLNLVKKYAKAAANFNKEDLEVLYNDILTIDTSKLSKKEEDIFMNIVVSLVESAPTLVSGAIDLVIDYASSKESKKYNSEEINPNICNKVLADILPDCIVTKNTSDIIKWKDETLNKISKITVDTQILAIFNHLCEAVVRINISAQTLYDLMRKANNNNYSLSILVPTRYSSIPEWVTRIARSLYFMALDVLNYQKAKETLAYKILFNNVSIEIEHCESHHCRSKEIEPQEIEPYVPKYIVVEKGEISKPNSRNYNNNDYLSDINFKDECVVLGGT